jgi:hypothetical protein
MDVEMEPKFTFYEKVVVRSDKSSLEEINGKLGAILGIGEDEGNGISYAVQIYDEDVGWSVMESDLESTGQFDSRDTFYEGDSVKVIVDDKGNGSLV